jgi:hypothetical protein
MPTTCNWSELSKESDSNSDENKVTDYGDLHGEQADPLPGLSQSD